MTIVAWGVIGAVLGDAVSYWIGRLAGPALVHRWPLKTHRRSVARARLFFTRYGFFSILLGRFLGPIRSTVPTVAGIMRMSHLKFEIANVLLALVWVPMLLAPGYFAARSLGASEKMQQTGMMVGAAASVIFGIVIAYAFVRKRKTPARARL